ncbi:MAG: hypothetical protein WC955_06980 [Elusimicrobiota bacterium]
MVEKSGGNKIIKTLIIIAAVAAVLIGGWFFVSTVLLKNNGNGDALPKGKITGKLVTTAAGVVYQNTEFNYAFTLPLRNTGWVIDIENLPATDTGSGEYVTILKSKDFVPNEKDGVITGVKNGVQMVVLITDPAPVELRTLLELQKYWKLGRGEHFAKSEVVKELTGKKFIIHTLGDFTDCKLMDAHTITGNAIYDISFVSAEIAGAELQFEEILRSLKFGK